MLTELINLGQAGCTVDAPPARSKTQKRLLGSPLGRFAATRLRSKAMSNNLINRGQERSVDTSYRAEISLSHPTYCIMPILRGFCVSLCARSWSLARNNLAILRISERAISALQGVPS